MERTWVFDEVAESFDKLKLGSSCIWITYKSLWLFIPALEGVLKTHFTSTYIRHNLTEPSFFFLPFQSLACFLIPFLSFFLVFGDPGVALHWHPSYCYPAWLMMFLCGPCGLCPLVTPHQILIKPNLQQADICTFEDPRSRSGLVNQMGL